MPTGLLFQTVTVMEEPPGGWDRREPPGAHVVLSRASETALPTHPLSRRVNKEIDAVANRIHQVMQARGGVLLTVSFQELMPSDLDATPSYRFNFVSVDRPGPVASLVLRTHLTSRPRLGEATDGYMPQEVFLWVTKAA
jgi:hypothetical protein